MELLYGVNIIDGQIEIEEHNSVYYYDYLVIATQLNERNGNGYRRLEFMDHRRQVAKDLIVGDWKIKSNVNVPFNWSGSAILAKVVDKFGCARDITKDDYSKTIFKGMNF